MVNINPSLHSDLFPHYSNDMLDLLFDQMPMGMVILDLELRLLRFNTTWANYVKRYSPKTLHLLQTGCGIFDALPSSQSALEALLNRARLGEMVREQALKIEADEAVTYVNIMVAPLFQNNIMTGIMLIGMNVTPQVTAQQELEQAIQSLQRSHEEIEQRVEERTHELTTLITVQQALTSTLHYDEVLQMIVREARRLTNTDVSTVFLPDDQGLKLAVLSSEYPVDVQPGYHISLTQSVTGHAFRTGKTQMVTDITRYEKVDPYAISKAQLYSILAVPLISGTQAIGVLSVGNQFGGTLGKEEERLLQMMVPSVVIALENVRRYEHASDIAIAAERGRLARDLHDAVTQTLFSASLTAEVLPRLWARNPVEGMQRLQKLRELTRGALAEMRTLLFELRPAALAEMALGDLLQQLAEGIAGRTRIHITVTVEGERLLPAEVKIALYRIAQEALNNVAKHSKAQNAQVTLLQTDQQVELAVKDDGCGFDPTSNRAKHLGLRIMAERGESIGANLTIETQKESGSLVKVQWSEGVEAHGI